MRVFFILGGLLPKAGTRSPSSIVPTAEDVRFLFFITLNIFSFFQRLSQLPPPGFDGDILPLLPSGFDDIPLGPLPSEPLGEIRQPFSPLQTSRRGRPTITTPAEPSPTWQDKQKRKAIDDILR
jgi:hypothetical protein